MPPRNDILERIFGSELEGLKQDRSQAFALLSSEDPNYRMGALWLLEKIFDVDVSIMLPLCMKLACSDPDEQVRAAALNVIGRLFASQSAEQPSAFLAQVVLNDQESTKVRRSAYLGLRKIQTPSPEHYDNFQVNQDLLAEFVSLMRHAKLDEEQLEWARGFLSG